MRTETGWPPLDVHRSIHTGVQCCLLSRCFLLGIDLRHKNLHILCLLAQVYSGTTSPDLIIFLSCSLQTLMNQSSDLWLPRGLCIFLLKVTSPSRRSWWLLTIIPIIMKHTIRCLMFSLPEALPLSTVFTGCITLSDATVQRQWARRACSLFISGKEQNMPLLRKEYFELKAIEEKERQEKLSAPSLFA